MTAGGDADTASTLWLDELTEAAWLLSAIGIFLDSDIDPSARGAATELLLARGLLRHDGERVVPTAAFASVTDGQEDGCRNIVRSVLSQSAALARQGFRERWQSQDSETLLAQGRASAMAGRFLGGRVVPALEGLADRFREGGVFLDVGVGVAELACAFCSELPSARVIGLDPFPLAIELARKTVAEHGLAQRIELRTQGIEDLPAEPQVDLAWLPAPFIPQSAVEKGVERIFTALRPGGWLIMPGTTLEPGVPGATARFQVEAAGGTAFTAAGRNDLLRRAGFNVPTRLDVPPGAPEMWAARRST